jgi:hypothetical protein
MLGRDSDVSSGASRDELEMRHCVSQNWLLPGTVVEITNLRSPV